MKKLLLTLLVITAPLFAHASLIWYDGINYADGILTNVSAGLWIKTSGTANPSDMLVKNKKVEISATGGTVTRQDDCYRKFALTPGSPFTNTVQLIYASFTVICTNLPNGAGSYFATIYNTAASGGGFFGRVQAFTNGTVLPNTWRLGVTAGASAVNPANGGYPADLALNTPYQVVEELDPVTLLAATIWINPINPNQAGDPGSPTPPTETHYTSSDSIGTSITSTNPVNAFAFRQASTFGNSFFQITNLALATTFAEAATNVWKTNAIAPIIVYQPPAATTNFVGATVSVGSVANGQGLGSLTYQWQLTNSANPTPVNVVNPNGNSNLLSVDTTVAVTNYYTLVVTTPFGLSVTSSVAKVLISAALVPPIFTSQPVSQTAYSGQTVIFSTTVISPGNVSYQWYSNTIALPGETASTLTLPNVPTNITGSIYKVAVTNDYANAPTNGVVSTNAVLTVLNPPSVSIAFLRTLVNPNDNYQATNSNLPFQVTGIVTTFTNLTSGNSSSYYLQDGTAGINIFATFGSTFRPAQGDVVTFVGVLSSFSSGLELFADTVNRTYTSYSIISNNFPLPTPLSVPFTITNNNFSNMNYTIAGKLVQLTNVFFGTNTGNTITAPASGVLTVSVTNGLGQRFNLVFTAQVLDTQGKILPDYAKTVTGVMFGSMNPTPAVGGVASPNFGVVVTKFSDIVTNPPAPATLSFSQAGNVLTFSWSASGFNLQSQTNSLSAGLDTNNASWINYPDPSNPVNIPIDPANPTVFYRLFHP